MKDLSLQDPTQLSILPILKETEAILADLASHLSGYECSATIYAMPDLGLPHAINSLHAGFFTGAYYTWDTKTPFIPIDMNITCCSVSVFKVDRNVQDEVEFVDLVRFMMKKTQNDDYYEWNFNSGNHFLTYGHYEGNGLSNDKYLVLHSSEDRNNRRRTGLYPTSGNWYSGDIRMYHRHNRMMRYIYGTTAETFIEKARGLVDLNANRHRYFAELFSCGEGFEEVLYLPHVGMPDNQTVAIGTQWVTGDDVILLTEADAPLPLLSLIQETEFPMTIGSELYHPNTYSLYPHGLGNAYAGNLKISLTPQGVYVNGKSYGLNQSLKDNDHLYTRSYDYKNDYRDSNILNQILHAFPADIRGAIFPQFSYHKKNYQKYLHG